MTQMDDVEVLRRAAEIMKREGAAGWSLPAHLADRTAAERARAADPVAQVVDIVRRVVALRARGFDATLGDDARAALAAYDAKQREAGR